MKYDGYRIVAYKEGESVRLMTRNGQDYTARFPTVVEAVRDLPDFALVLDGEIVAMKDGRSDFSALQRYLREGVGSISYV
ncbi:MAG TPA: hypothetical protein GXZ89_07600, partial [Fastidiosipila sp.]|nr:hypothetical protein [Fastidiosipila sp.]